MAQTYASPSPIGKKVLCVEDEHFIGELYVRALTRAGYEVTIEADGQQGLELALTNQYDFILLDIMIPTITGIEVLGKLRDPSVNPPIHGKIIITTNLDQREDIRSAIEHQADGYLVKAEVTPRELVEVINKMQ